MGFFKPEHIDVNIVLSYSFFWFFYFWFLWLNRKKYPLQYCAINPFYRAVYLIWFLMLLFRGLLKEFFPFSFQTHLITFLVINAMLICLLILKQKQILRSPLFEFWNLKDDQLKTFKESIDQFVYNKLPNVNKSDNRDIGFEEIYYFYESNEHRFLYVEVNNLGFLYKIKMEFYPYNDFGLIEINHLMRELNQAFSKHIKASYERSKPKLELISALVFITMMITLLFMGIYSVPQFWMNAVAILSIFLVFLFLYIDVFRKPDKNLFLNNLY